MLKKCLLIIITIAVLVSFAGCGTIRSLFSKDNPVAPESIEDHAAQGNITGNADGQTGIGGPGAVHVNGRDVSIPESEYLLFMRLHVNGENNESYDVVRLTEHTLTYRYYDYSDPGNPVPMERTVTFGEILARENGRDKYTMTIYLFDGVNEYEMELTSDLKEKIRQYPEFRKTLGTLLGKPFNRPLDGNVITTEDISVTARENTAFAEMPGDTDSDAEVAAEGETALELHPAGYSTWYTVTGEVHAEKDGALEYRIEYPQVSGLDDEGIRKKINDTIKQEALKALAYCKGSRPSENMDISYRISRRSSSLLSVEFSGTAYFTLIFDTRTGNRVRLKDFVNIDAGFAGRLPSGRYTTIGDPATEALANLDAETLKKLLEKADATENLGSQEKPHVFSYLTTDSLGISISFGHDTGEPAESQQDGDSSALAGRVVFEVEFGDIEDNLAAGETLREELLATDIERIVFMEVVDFEDLGKIRLTAGKRDSDGVAKLKLLFEDENGGFVYMLPEPADIPWHFENLSILQVMDADADGLSDIVVVALYANDAQAGKSDLFAYPHVYFRRSSGFARYAELEQKIYSDGFASAEDVVRLVRKYMTGRQ